MVSGRFSVLSDTVLLLISRAFLLYSKPLLGCGKLEKLWKSRKNEGAIVQELLCNFVILANIRRTQWRLGMSEFMGDAPLSVRE